MPALHPETGNVRAVSSGSDRRQFVLAVLSLLIAGSYVFFVTGSTWKKVTRHQYAYYTKLADGFLRFQTSVAIEPHPSLLTNGPDNPEAREHLLWDLSFYKGQYYIYWGYVPALIIAIGKLIGFKEMTDGHATLLFQLIRVLAVSLLMLEVLRRFSSERHLALFSSATLAAAWSVPFPYALGRAAVYEASISGGQCFFFVGLLMLFLALNEDGQKSRTRLMFAGGTSFCLAINCRLVLLPSLVAVAAITAWFGRQQRTFDRAARLRGELALFGPVILGLASLAVYNYARFDSPFEFGYSYIRTYPFPKHTMSTIYLPSNLWNYFLRPPQILPEFPFITAPWDADKLAPVPLRRPRGYINREPVIGLLYGVPVALLFLLAPWHGWRRWLDSRVHDTDVQEGEASLSWLLIAVTIFGLMSLMTTGLYFVCTMRYEGDFLPALLLGGFVGTFLHVRNRHPSARVLNAAFCAMAVIGCVVGWLLWTDSYIGLLQWRNPQLYAYLVRLFGGS